MQQSQKFVGQKRCEIAPELDYCSLQSYSQKPVWNAAMLGHLWLSGLLFCGGEGAEKFQAAHNEAANGRSFQQDVAAGRKTVASLRAALRRLKLGAATPVARCGQWRKGSCKQQAATVLAELISSKRLQAATDAIRTCVTEEEVNKVLEDKTQVRQRFLRYLLYRDFRQYFPELPESLYVGKEAQQVLKEATAVRKAKTSSEKRLQELTAHLRHSLPKKLVALVSRRGWEHHHTEHACCELRRYRAGSSGGRKRKRDADRDRRQDQRLRMVRQAAPVLQIAATSGSTMPVGAVGCVGPREGAGARDAGKGGWALWGKGAASGRCGACGAKRGRETIT